MRVATEEPHVVILESAAHDIVELAIVNVTQVKPGATNAHLLDSESTANSLLNGVNLVLSREFLCIAHYIG